MTGVRLVSSKEMIVQPQNGGNGGDVTFAPGKGGRGKDGGNNGIDGSIRFRCADGTDFLVLHPDGTASVNGEPVESKQDVYDAFVQWLVHAKYYPEHTGDLSRDPSFTPNES